MRPSATAFDFLVRIWGWSTLVLLAVAYATGEEFPHTHRLIGYALAGVIAAGVCWTIVRPQNARLAGSVFSPETVRSMFRATLTGTDRDPAGPVFLIVLAFIVPLLATIALFAVTAIFVTHAAFGATAVDEMHEAVACIALGLAVFYVAVVVAGAGEHALARLSRALGGKR